MTGAAFAPGQTGEGARASVPRALSILKREFISGAFSLSGCS